MAELSEAALREALGRSFVSSDGTAYDIEDLDARILGRQVGLTFTMTVRPGHSSPERWAVSMDYDLDRDLFEPNPADPLGDIVFLALVHLEEWWHMKRSSGTSRKMGHRLD